MAHTISGVSGGRDENGIITVTQPWHCDTIDECFTVGDATLMGLPESRRDFGTWDPEFLGAGYQIGITYQGPDQNNPEGEETFDLEDNWSTEPIETHFAIDVLINDWGARLVDVGGETRLVMPKDLPEGSIEQSGGGFQLTESGKEAAKTNPHFGHTSYELYGAIWVHTYVRRRIPGDLLERIGNVVKRPPGNPPTPEGRDWAIMGPNMTIYKGDRGVRITDRYKLSPPGGWPPGFQNKLVV